MMKYIFKSIQSIFTLALFWALAVGSSGDSSDSSEPEAAQKVEETVNEPAEYNPPKPKVEATNNPNRKLMKEIGSQNYLWEVLDLESWTYMTMSFDLSSFSAEGYKVNKYARPGDSDMLEKLVDLSGRWTVIDDYTIEGIWDGSDTSTVSWEFSKDYSTMTNSRGVVYDRRKTN